MVGVIEQSVLALTLVVLKGFTFGASNKITVQVYKEAELQMEL